MMSYVARVAVWAVAFGWLWKTTGAVRGLPTVERIDEPEWDVWPEALPGLTVVVPGRDEGTNIAATLASLVVQDYRERGGLRVVAIDDRSTDATGLLMDDCAAEYPEWVSAVHVTDLPEGWLGKTHALHAALTVGPRTKYLLFTDADVRFAPSVLRRALAYAEREKLDHLVVMPQAEIRQWSEGILLGVFHTFVVWAARPWKVPDPRAKRDVIGIGAFNLVRRAALEELGGLAPQALVVLEDITIARRMKSAGMRSRVAFARGMVQVHWASGMRGQMDVMAKNLFSAFNFSLPPALMAVAGMAAFGLLPLLGLLWWKTTLPALVILGCVLVVYRICAGFSSIPARYAWTYPLGAVLFSWTILRSMWVVLRDGGVRWRGTLYSLRELRKHNSPFRWKL